MSYYLPFDPIIRLGQQFGWNPGLGPNPAGGHNGDDWLTPVGTPVRAAGDGEVVFAGQFDDTHADNWGWNLMYGGLMVVLNMDGPTAPYFEYGHNSRILVKTGDRVKAGQIIAITGNTDGGTKVSTGPHCHVGALPWNYNLGTNTYGRVNPRLYMTKHWDGGIVLASTSESTQEDELSAAESKHIIESVQAMINHAVDGRLLKEIPGHVWSYKNGEERDAYQILRDTASHNGQIPGGNYWADLIGAVDKINGGVDNLVHRPVADIAKQLDAAGLAIAVRDELIELLKGKES